jgi:hypothetical protein
MHQEQRGICVEWDNTEHTIIRWDFYVWTYADFHDAIQITFQMFAAAKLATHPPSILNLTHSARIPLGAFLHSRVALQLMDQQSYTVVAGASGFARQITEMFINFNPTARSKVFIADTLEEARLFISRRQNGLE